MSPTAESARMEDAEEPYYDDGAELKELKPETFSLVAPPQIDSDLMTERRNDHRWLAESEITSQEGQARIAAYRERWGKDDLYGNNARIRCYRSEQGKWIPELRGVIKINQLRTRMRKAFRKADHSGTLFRQGDELARKTYGAMVGEHALRADGSPRPVLTLTTNEDPHGKVPFHDRRVRPDERPRVFRALDNREVRPKPPHEIKQDVWPFEGITTDAQTVAFFNPETGKWTIQVLPDGDMSFNLWESPFHYAGDGGIIGGMVAYRRRDGVYVINAHEHIQRYVRDARATGLKNVTPELVRSMLSMQLEGDKANVPTLEGDEGSPDRRMYVRPFAVSTAIAPPIAGQNRMMGMLTTLVGPYKQENGKTVDELHIRILDEERPVPHGNGGNKRASNYHEVTRAAAAAMERDRASGRLVGNRKYHEYMFRTEGDETVQEGVAANVAWATRDKNGKTKLYIPDYKKIGLNILESNTMHVLGQLAAAEGFEVVEFNPPLNLVLNGMREGKAQPIYTGTAMGILPAKTVTTENETIECARIPEAYRLRDAYVEMLRGTHRDPKINSIMERVVAFDEAA